MSFSAESLHVSLVLAWLKAQGPGYQTRINAILRACKEASG